MAVKNFMILHSRNERSIKRQLQTGKRKLKANKDKENLAEKVQGQIFPKKLTRNVNLMGGNYKR